VYGSWTQQNASDNCAALNYQNPSYFCTDLNTGYCSAKDHKCFNSVTNPTYCHANMIDGTSIPATIPVPSAISLIFVAFFVGILLSYVIYKCRKSSLNQKYDATNQALSESSHRSTEESQVGEKPLNLSPLSEQV
jgi:hypothetical protein